jgi:5-methylcytosine-specific restriction protein A
MGVTRFKRYSAWVTKSKRWPALRQQALRRDGFACVKCGKAGRLEVDHIQPVRTRPELAFILDNLQCLCISDHTRKSHLECGHPPVKPERVAWLKAVRELSKTRAIKDHHDA